MIVEQRGERRFLRHQSAALCTAAEGLLYPAGSRTRQTIDHVEDLFGIFLVGNQFAEMGIRLEQPQLRVRPRWIAQGTDIGH
jgi:hypothetical protein